MTTKDFRDIPTVEADKILIKASVLLDIVAEIDDLENIVKQKLAKAKNDADKVNLMGEQTGLVKAGMIPMKHLNSIFKGRIRELS